MCFFKINFAGLLMFTFLSYMLAIGAVVLMYMFYTAASFGLINFIHINELFFTKRIIGCMLFCEVVIVKIWFKKSENLLQGNSCHMPKLFISLNIILCVLVSVLSILPRIQERMPRSGLLQSSFITLYVMYITWSALINNPGLLLFSMQLKNLSSNIKKNVKKLA